MMTKSRAIVLNSLKFGDSQLIVDLLTKQQGRLTFICHIPNNSKGKIKKQYFQSLSILDLEYDFRMNAKFQHFKEVSLAIPFSTIPFDLYKLSISFFVAEFLYYSTRDEQKNELLYQYIEHSVMWLDNANENFSNFHLVFMMRLSRFLGFFPNLDNYHEADYFDLREGRFVTMLPIHSDFLGIEEASKIALLMRLSYKTMHFCTFSRLERDRCAEVILYYYRLHIPNFPELKSLSVLKDLYNG